MNLRWTRAASLLDVVTNLIVVATCVVVCIVLAKWYVDPGDDARPVTRRPFAVEDTADPLDGYSFLGGANTLVIGINSRCSFCTSSMPYLRALTQGRDRGDLNVRVVAVSTDQVAVTRQYLSAEGVVPDHIVAVPSTSRYISSTPALFVVDARRQVRSVWVGAIRGDQGSAVTMSLGLAAREEWPDH